MFNNCTSIINYQAKTQIIISLPVNVLFTGMTQVSLCLKRTGTNEVEGSGKAEVREAEFLAACEVCKAFGLLQALKRQPLIALGSQQIK